MTNKLPHARKRFGQNWLVNWGILHRIVRELDPGPGIPVVEIGPGPGTLTELLARTGARIIAVEKDPELLEPLHERLAAFPNVRIIEGDALRFEPGQHGLEPERYDVVGNIPYYLTSRLIRLILERWRPRRAILMVQREVAQRIMAHPPDMNLLALSVQLFAVPGSVMRVSRGSFRPVPDVDSELVRLDLLPPGPRGQRERALELARSAFVHKRKQLAASVPPDRLVRAGVAPSARPQELGPDDWLRLSTIGSER